MEGTSVYYLLRQNPCRETMLADGSTSHCLNNVDMWPPRTGLKPFAFTDCSILTRIVLVTSNKLKMACSKLPMPHNAGTRILHWDLQPPIMPGLTAPHNSTPYTT
jgi:hypothetical protein